MNNFLFKHGPWCCLFNKDNQLCYYRFKQVSAQAKAKGFALKCYCSDVVKPLSSYLKYLTAGDTYC